MVVRTSVVARPTPLFAPVMRTMRGSLDMFALLLVAGRAETGGWSFLWTLDVVLVMVVVVLLLLSGLNLKERGKRSPGPPLPPLFGEIWDCSRYCTSTLLYPQESR